MSRYTIALVGCGPRGERHARAVLANPERFDLVAMCDLDRQRLGALAEQCRVTHTYTDADTMLAAEQPDILYFAMLPATRLPLIELGVKHHVKAIAYEKPMALSLAEAKRMTDMCATAGIKTIVCHQLKYGAHWQKVWKIVHSGELGDIHTIHAHARPSMLRVGTHLVDAMLWMNGGHSGAWVLGQAQGKEAYREDHPCPDHISGVIQFSNGVRGILECGRLAPQLMDDDDFWLDGAVTVYGSRGYARAGIGSGWQAVTASSGGTLLSGPSDLRPQEPRFIRQLADWLDESQQVHPCNGEVSYHGFELLMGMAHSALERRQVEMPMAPVPSVPVLEQLESVL
ncbi:Inositol 2-dehydrogenase/D-chiro-inositol 3-dehydrogenase [Candidatus Entotheonellaceae bacterium PAL068K]